MIVLPLSPLLPKTMVVVVGGRREARREARRGVQRGVRREVQTKIRWLLATSRGID